MSDRPTTVPADPNQWSEESKRSVAFDFRRAYTDQPYACWRCGAACVFTAQDQKYTYEIKKANINQHRKFCAACWSQSHQLRAALAERELRWAADRCHLQADREFLTEWLELLVRWKTFAPRAHQVARINTLRNLLGPDK